MTKPLVTPTTESEAFEEMFGNVISSYTEEQAIEDGHLHHLWADRWPWLLVTDTVYRQCEEVAAMRVDECSTPPDVAAMRVDECSTPPDVALESVLAPLAMDCIMETQRQSKVNPRCDLVELEHTAIGTVWVRPNSKGGMTIMTPPRGTIL
jgi:hypothetical protein